MLEIIAISATVGEPEIARASLVFPQVHTVESTVSHGRMFHFFKVSF
jgi:hypothetical protein